MFSKVLTSAPSNFQDVITAGNYKEVYAPDRRAMNRMVSNHGLESVIESFKMSLALNGEKVTVDTFAKENDSSDISVIMTTSNVVISILRSYRSTERQEDLYTVSVYAKDEADKDMLINLVKEIKIHEALNIAKLNEATDPKEIERFIEFHVQHTLREIA